MPHPFNHQGRSSARSDVRLPPEDQEPLKRIAQVLCSDRTPTVVAFLARPLCSAGEEAKMWSLCLGILCCILVRASAQSCSEVAGLGESFRATLQSCTTLAETDGSRSGRWECWWYDLHNFIHIEDSVLCLSLCPGTPQFVHVSSPVTGSVYEDDPEGNSMHSGFVACVGTHNGGMVHLSAVIPYYSSDSI